MGLFLRNNDGLKAPGAQARPPAAADRIRDRQRVPDRGGGTRVRWKCLEIDHGGGALCATSASWSAPQPLVRDTVSDQLLSATG